MGALKSLKQLLNDQVVKCSTDSCKRYCFMRFCDDKARANHTSARDSVIESITDRVMEKDLIAAAKGIRDEWKRATVREKMVASTVVAG
jgi:mRNA guanylyltransferase